MFPDPTQDEQEHMEKLALSIASKYLRPSDDLKALAEDLRGAGWLAFYMHYGKEHQWRDVFFAMLQAWNKWIFGVRWRNKKDRKGEIMLHPLPEDWERRLGDSRCESSWEAHDILSQLGGLIAQNPRYRGLRACLCGLRLAEGQPLTQTERLFCGITNNKTYSDQKKILRRLVTELEQGAA